MAHILVVDDDDGFREGLVETLVDLGHEVDEASSGEQALEILVNAAAPFTCMFLDFRFPGMDGLAVLEAMQTTGQAPPVVMLTGFASSDNTIGAMKTGDSVITRAHRLLSGDTRPVTRDVTFVCC
jgi:CheY-like chemotaxis protein